MQFHICLILGIRRNKPHPAGAQCDQMARLFINIWQFTIIEIYPIAYNCCQSRIKVLPNTKQTLGKLPKTFKFCKSGYISPIWSHCCWRYTWLTWPTHILYLMNESLSDCVWVRVKERDTPHSQFDHIWGKFAILTYFSFSLGVYLIFGRLLNLLWKLFMLLGQFSLFKMAKYWTNIVAIWSHWAMVCLQ